MVQDPSLAEKKTTTRVYQDENQKRNEEQMRLRDEQLRINNEQIQRFQQLTEEANKRASSKAFASSCLRSNVIVPPFFI